MGTKPQTKLTQSYHHGKKNKRQRVASQSHTSTESQLSLGQQPEHEESGDEEIGRRLWWVRACVDGVVPPPPTPGGLVI